MVKEQLRPLDRIVWLVTSLGSLPFVFLLLLLPPVDKFQLFLLIVLAAVTDGFFIPFFLLRGPLTFWKRAFASGTNLFFASWWILITGGAQSPFIPALFFLPVLAVCIYRGDFPDSILTGLAATGLMLWIAGRSFSPFFDPHFLSQLTAFWLVTIIISYLLGAERKERADKENLAGQLAEALEELNAAHQQLAAYTRTVEKLNRELEQLAITDELTELYNYRYFRASLEQQLERHRSASLSLLMLDLDHFKEINDRYGHDQGNEVLAEFGRLLKAGVREGDIVVRYGGEEFAVILPFTSGALAVQVAERLRANAAAHAFKVSTGETITLTVSIGVAVFPDDAKDKSELISHADLALYHAKQTGRNRVVRYGKECAE